MPYSVIVRAGDCPCPGAPHTEERVDLLDTLTLPLASAALVAMRSADSTIPAQEAAIIEAILPAAIVDWSFVEGNPNGPGVVPVEINRENMERLIPWSKGGFEVAEEADSRFSAELMAPLVRRMQRSSQDGPTESSTSLSPTSSDTPPKRSRRSSRASGDGRRSGAPAP